MSEWDKSDFECHYRAMAIAQERGNHLNILELTGVISHDCVLNYEECGFSYAYALLTAYCKYGILLNFLKKHMHEKYLVSEFIQEFQPFYY